jgi:hypothetical protein
MDRIGIYSAADQICKTSASMRDSCVFFVCVDDAGGRWGTYIVLGLGCIGNHRLSIGGQLYVDQGWIDCFHSRENNGMISHDAESTPAMRIHLF